jgi:hypothetical protein
VGTGKLAPVAVPAPIPLAGESMPTATGTAPSPVESSALEVKPAGAAEGTAAAAGIMAESPGAPLAEQSYPAVREEGAVVGDGAPPAAEPPVERVPPAIGAGEIETVPGAPAPATGLGSAAVGPASGPTSEISPVSSPVSSVSGDTGRKVCSLQRAQVASMPWRVWGSCAAVNAWGECMGADNVQNVHELAVMVLYSRGVARRGNPIHS